MNVERTMVGMWGVTRLPVFKCRFCKRIAPMPQIESHEALAHRQAVETEAVAALVDASKAAPSAKQ